MEEKDREKETEKTQKIIEESAKRIEEAQRNLNDFKIKQPQFRLPPQQEIPQQYQPNTPQPQNNGYNFSTLTVLENLHGMLERYRNIPGVYPEDLRSMTIAEINKLRNYQSKLNSVPNETKTALNTVFSQVIMPVFTMGD